MKYKKYFLFLMSFLIVLSSLGISFNVHFCEGKIAAISSEFSQPKKCEMLAKVDEKKCCKKKIAAKKCCSDKKVSFKSKTEKITYKTSFTFDSYLVLNEINYVFETPFVSIQNNKKDYYSFESNAPPLYKLFCKLTFYA